MSRSLAVELSGRLLSHRSNGFARFVTWVSFLGLTAGVTILTLVVTVMNGFDSELKNRLLNTLPHVSTQSQLSAQDIELIRRDVAGIRTVSRYVRAVAGIVGQGRILPVSVFAARDETALSYLDERVYGDLGDVFDDPHGVAVGLPLARANDLSIGDQVSLIVPVASGETIRPRTIRFVLRATFSLGAEPDYNLVVANFDRFPEARWREVGEVGTQIQLVDPLHSGRVISRLEKLLPGVAFTSWTESFGELFQAVRLEKTMMFVLLLLVVAIASFNIVAGQSMLVSDKRRNIAILRTMGCRQSTIRNVFLLQGIGISSVGTTLGLVLGVVASANVNQILALGEQLTGMHLLDGSFFVEVPVKVLFSDLVLIAVMSISLCLLASWIPARRAAQMDPVPSLH